MLSLMATSSSCSHWWHAPIYFAMSITLAAIAISASLPSTPTTTNSPTQSNQAPIINHTLSLNASKALRKQGFNFIATLLQISPELFFSSSPSSSQSTIFAIPDSAISNVSVSPLMMKHLLQYHTSPSNLPIQQLFNKPKGFCLPTLFRNKNIVITKSDYKEKSIEINNVLISHPDVFLDGNFTIHGVLGTFSSVDLHGFDQDQFEIIQSHVCDSNYSKFLNILEWRQVVRLLSSKGFVSFAIGLHSVLDEIVQDYPNLNSVTIFAPMDLEFVSSPSPFLDRIVRFHVLPRRFTYIELSSMAERAIIRTLVPDKEIVITRRVNSTKALAINGVEIVAPDIFSSNKFVIHGISRALNIEDLPSTFR